MLAFRYSIKLAAVAGLCAAACFSQAVPPDLKTKVDAKVKELQPWSTDPAIVAAVKQYNAKPPAEYAAMTQEKWAALTVLDPLVRGLAKNALAQALKARQGAQIMECFVSGADGTKVAFLSKTSNWSHKDKDKHKIPMTGKTYVGPVAMDDSTGMQEVQIGLPVLDGGKPIGSIVVGLGVSKL